MKNICLANLSLSVAQGMTWNNTATENFTRMKNTVILRNPLKRAIKYLYFEIKI